VRFFIVSKTLVRLRYLRKRIKLIHLSRKSIATFATGYCAVQKQNPSSRDRSEPRSLPGHRQAVVSKGLHGTGLRYDRAIFSDRHIRIPSGTTGLRPWRNVSAFAMVSKKAQGFIRK
jgi:hypothetical protein